MRQLQRLAKWALLTVCVAYIGICALLLIAQNRLLYIGTVLPPHPAISFPTFNGPDGKQIGWLAEPAGPVNGTIVYFHGNDEEAWQADRDYAGYFTSRGWRVIFPEYRGYDFRHAENPTHDNVIADAVAAMQLARVDFPAGPVGVAGNSLGAGIAAQAAKPGRAQRVLLFVPWDSMGAVAQERYPFVPTRLLLRLDGTEYDSCAALTGIPALVFITYAGRDRIIPPQHAEHLATCLHLPPSQIFALPESGHLDWHHHLTPPQWDQFFAGRTSKLMFDRSRF